jgi:diguanylate cyclase (GGDEF)-like protein/PAS domain S-box-containing protein
LLSSKDNFFNKEIYKLLKDIQYDIAFALEKINQKELLDQISHFKELLSNINYLIAHADSLETLFEQVCNLAISHTDLALVYIAMPNQEGYLEFLASCGKTQYLKDNKISIDESKEEGQGNVGQSFRKKSPVYTNSILNADYMKPWHEKARQFNLNASGTLPIFVNNQIWGVFGFYHEKEYAFENTELKNILNDIASALGYAIERFQNQKWQDIINTALNSGFDLVVITDKDFNIVYVSDKITQNFGYTRKELLGKHHSIFSSNRYSKEFVKNFYNTLQSGHIYTGILTYKLKNNSLEDFYATIIPYFEQDSITHYIGIVKEIGKDKELLKELKRALKIDPLTNLDNMSSFLERIDYFIERASKEKTLGAVAIINPISFSNINEGLGLEIGNQVLVQIANRLKQTVFEYDVVAKLESDRFGILLKDFRYEEDVLVALSKILFELTKPYTIAGNTISLSFNIGLSLFPKDATSSKELINRAYIALKDAKEKGENQIGFFKKDFEEKALTLIKLKADLELAVANKEFLAYYQPYVDRSKKIAGAEALMRLRKNNKIIPPVEFIDYLERTGLILQTQDQIIDSVLSLIKQNKLSIPISVNLSENILKQRNLLQTILSKLNYYNVAPNLIKLELIERVFMDDPNYLKNLIQEFKDEGISFCIDDFGTGYSSLSYLTTLSIDYLKIDISFVRNIHLQTTQSVVKSIIFMAKELNMKTIAEGVETIEQFQTLLNFGCDYFQGYLFYKPMPRKEFLRALDEA